MEVQFSLLLPAPGLPQGLFVFKMTKMTPLTKLFEMVANPSKLGQVFWMAFPIGNLKQCSSNN